MLTAFASHAFACSSNGQGGLAPARGTAPEAGSEAEALIVPQALSVLALAGGNGVLDLFALTLRQRKNGVELYAALRNDGDVPACHALLSLELYDHAQLSLAVGSGALLSTHFYRLSDDSGTVAACVAPGDVTMAAIGDLPPEIASEDVGYVVYRCPYFALSVTPLDGLRVADLKHVASGSGATYTGNVSNSLDFSVKDPSVVVFPRNRVGRPLGVVMSGASLQIPPGGSWAFETGPLDIEETADDQMAFPEASFAN